jgi:phosphoserine phosphatase
MLVAFDFDGTLSDSEMTVLLGEEQGVAGDIGAITERAMNDEIDYAESLRQRVDLLGGLPEAEAQRAFERVRLHDGAAGIISALREANHHVAILTGGFETGVETALDAAGVGVDTVMANRLPREQGALSGEVEGPLVEGTKDDALTTLAAEQDLPMSDTVAVGDGANDLPMLQVAGTSIGFDPKAAVARTDLDHTVNGMRELREFFVEHGFVEEP